MSNHLTGGPPATPVITLYMYRDWAMDWAHVQPKGFPGPVPGRVLGLGQPRPGLFRSLGTPGVATYLCRLTGMMVTARVADFGLGPSVPPTGPSKLRLQAGKFWRFWGAETPISQKRRP